MLQAHEQLKLKKKTKEKSFNVEAIKTTLQGNQKQIGIAGSGHPNMEPYDTTKRKKQ